MNDISPGGAFSGSKSGRGTENTILIVAAVSLHDEAGDPIHTPRSSRPMASAQRRSAPWPAASLHTRQCSSLGQPGLLSSRLHQPQSAVMKLSGPTSSTERLSSILLGYLDGEQPGPQDMIADSLFNHRYI